MKKQVLIAFAVGLCLTVNIWAQVPSYVPINGLVGYWPFNGNANDESGNGNNGTVNGATLTTDRFGVANKAYYFDGVDDFININSQPNISNFPSGQTISFWLKIPSFPSDGKEHYIFDKSDNIGLPSVTFYQSMISNYSSVNEMVYRFASTAGSSSQGTSVPFANIPLNQWFHVCFSTDLTNTKAYINGNLFLTYVHYAQIGTTTNPLKLGVRNGAPSTSAPYNGNLDDFLIFNRALNTCEIQDLYNSQINSVAGSILTSPQSAAVGSTVTLSSSTTSQNVQWQNNPLNNGWQNVPSNATYSGGNTNTLTVNNVQLSNHNQPFRLIANAGNCSDTSNVATIQIADTCITNVTIYDTLLTTVTDTLIINTTLSLPAPNNENTILIYPNPASDHITIDNGNFASMAGYSIKIENNAGQQVFQSAINQAQFYVDLSTWTGNGLYFVHLIDVQGNTVTVRKIVLQ
jgi:hypothetical protein